MAIVSGASFEDWPVERENGEPELVVALDGFEGPLDLLLDLARRQKVDLYLISVSALADQYLAFIASVRDMRLELAADYLVMAAWLAVLKSRLLLPRQVETDEPGAPELAAALAQRLRRLDAIREAARLLAERPRLGRDVHARGGPGAVLPAGAKGFAAELYDLLSAYARHRQRRARPPSVTVMRRQVWSLGQARAALERELEGAEWIALDGRRRRQGVAPELRRTFLASSLAAALELVREGRAVIRQDGPFQPLMVGRAGAAHRLAA